VELVIRSAARRLAILVAGALVLASVPFVRDAHIGALPAAMGGLAIALLAAALLPLARATRLLRQPSHPAKPPPAAMVYRTVATDEDDSDPAAGAATRPAAVAFLLLALAAALTIVAAAAR
jgi:hypothetical protein